MPLLKKKPFEKAPIPENLRDDEEVFYCDVSKEIFRDYEEFSERMFLYNSMVWTCSMTGKSNLTYSEALESEENAKKSLKEFPMELRLPILYIASKTQRSSFGDMAEDVFMYAKDRYFIGENLETSFTGNKWKDSHVLQVIAPTEKAKSPVKNGSVEKHFTPPASSYKYEIEHLDADDEDISEIMIVDCNQIRRKKGTFSREKSKLFLKQYVEQDDRGIFVIKQSVLDDFGITKMKFDQIFAGPLPNFDVSKKSVKALNGKKVTKQETLAKYLSKNNTNGGIKEKKNNLLEQMKKREEEFKIQKQLKDEERLALRRKRREENNKISGYLKEWYKPKEDLELEDQMKLPEPTPIKSIKIPDKYLGDTFMIMEFVDNFSKFLSTKDFFPGGFTLEIMERALTEKEVAGPLTDLIQMFLTAIFTLQDDEINQYKMKYAPVKDIKDSSTRFLDNNPATAIRLASTAAHWSSRYQGVSLSKLPLYSLTVSEILRLHLLSSGARINETGERWRFQERGGYTSVDDPGLQLRLHQSHILKALAVHNVVQLPMGDKFKIISCLIDQLLTYADVRDFLEEKLEKNRQTKLELKAAQVVEKKREQEYITAKLKVKREGKDDPKALATELERLEKEAERKQTENERKIKKLMNAAYEKQILFGMDRAYRRYLKLDSIPALLVNFEEDNPGVCLPEPVKQNPELVNASRDDTLKHIRKIFDGMNSSDKENEPSTSPKKVNGVLSPKSQKDDSDLLMCSSDPINCIVHSNTIARTTWSFYHAEEEVQKLVESLNKRGIRESELQQALRTDEESIAKILSMTPAHYLNESVENNGDEEKRTRRVTKVRYEDANLGFPLDMSPDEVLHNAMIDNILEMEEKIFAGSLGHLKVKNRDEWRNCLAHKKYDELDTTIIKQETTNRHLEVKKEEKNSRPNTPDSLDMEDTKDYQDPGRFLGPTLEVDSEDSDLDNNEIVLVQSEELNKAIRSLAIALTQVAYAVEPKYLKKPLGHMELNKKDQIRDRLCNWEQSLLAATSFSQVFLHYGTLDSCVMWSRSALLARCRICRRQRDSENMLLCDSCNLGHHLYCLKPKLTTVPSGDWFCYKCLQEKAKREKLLSPDPPPKKRRTLFKEEDVEEEEEVDDDEENVDEVNSDEEAVEEDDQESVTVQVELCKTCGSGGELINCEKCSTNFHIECVSPPLRRVPRGSWFCNTCKVAKEKKEKQESDELRRYCGVVVQRTGVHNQRRCAAKARYKIHDFAKSLRRVSDSDDSGDEVVQNRRSHRRDEVREDLPLHNAALHELLSDVMKHKDAWPFLRPVQKNEVPDYYEVITKPMDFGTIKYKLNMGEYNSDAKLMQDVVLIFGNCNTYNHTDDDVYKCGVRLQKHLQKKCKELGLKVPVELMEEENLEAPKSKKRRYT